MSVNKEKATRVSKFNIRGQIALEKCDTPPGDLQLQAYAFNNRRQFLASGQVNEEGEFSIPLELEEPEDIELFIGPENDPKTLRQTSAYTEFYTGNDWVHEEGHYVLQPKIHLPYNIWWPWRPIRVCVSGHVRKLTEDGVCPVPFVKVEIFDVDREFCWWPYIVRWYDKLKYQRVFPVEDIVLERYPFPDPVGPVINPGVIEGFNPQPDPPSSQFDKGLDRVSLNPQPEVPSAPERLINPATLMAVGEMRGVEPSLAQSLQELTLTSTIAPWLHFPRCYYSRELVCQTYTDCEGYFRCCFKWSQFHIRRGRLRYDARPDIIVRVTQIIDGVKTVIYLDPYTSTRWNVTDTHIDLFLDNEEVRCGSPQCDDIPDGSEVFFTRVGDHDVYKIHQGNGLYPNPSAPGVDLSISNLAYGSRLKLHAAFGNDLADGSPKRYYRLSYAKQITPGVTPPDTDFQPIKMPYSPSQGFEDTQVEKLTLVSKTYKLGPHTVGLQQGLYEVRDTVHYHWYHQEEIGDWLSGSDEPNTGIYVLRLEVFDEAGNKLNTSSGLVDYRDGTHVPTTPSTPLPAMTDHCDMVITLDNKPIKATLKTPATNNCGVVTWKPGLTLSFDVDVAQGNGRVHSWRLYYTKGTDSTAQDLVTPIPSSNSGMADVSTTVNVPNSDPMISGLSSTCAFAIKLSGWAHVTNGRDRYIFYNEDLQSIAIEKCD